MRFFISFLLVFYFYTVCAFAQTEEVIKLKKETDLLLVGKQSYFLEDKAGKLKIQDVIALDKAGKFELCKKDVFAKASTRSVYWFKIRVQNDTKENAWLDIGSLFLWYIDFYAPDSSNIYTRPIEVGVLRPHENKPYPSNTFWLPLNVSGDTKIRTYYLRISTERAMEMPLRVGTLRALHGAKTVNDFIVGAFLGLTFIMFLYNLFVYFSTRDRLYLLYVGYLSAIFFVLPFTNNYAFLDNLEVGFITKNWWHTHTFVWNGIAYFFIGYFSLAYLRLRERLPVLYWIILIQTSFLVIVTPLLRIIGVPHLYLAFTQQNVLLMNSLTIIVTAYYILSKGHKEAYYYVLGWTFLMGSLVIYIITINGFTSYNVYTRNALYFGTAIEIWLFSLALGDRFNKLKNENTALINKQNVLLEQKVKQRTEDLELINEELKAQKEEAKQNTEYLTDANENISLTVKKLEKAQESLVLRNQEVRQKEEQLRRVIDSVPSHLYELEFDTKTGQAITLLSSQASEKLYGIPDEEMRENSMRVMKAIHPEDLPAFAKSFEKVINQKTIQEVVFRAVHPDGTVKWLHGTMLPTIRQEGNLLLTGLVNDITAQKEAEALIIYKGQLLSAIASATDKLMKIDDRNVAIANAFRIIGNAVGADRVYYYQNTFTQTAKGATNQRITWIRQNDAVIQNTPRYQNVPFENLSDLHEQLTENNAFEKIISTLPASQFKTDLMALEVKSVMILPLYVAGKFYGFVGFDDCSRERVWLSEEIAILQSLVANVATTLERSIAETALKASEKELKANFEELQSTQNQLIESEKMAVLGQLIAGVAHEVNNPLGAIKASGNHIKNVLEQDLPLLPAFFNEMSAEVQQACINLILQATQNRTTLSTKEDRALRREWRNILADKAFEDADVFAENLVEMGVTPTQYDEFRALLEDKNAEKYAKTLMRLTELLKSAKIINTAVERAAKIVFALKKFSHTESGDVKTLTNLQETIETVLTLYHNQIKRGIELITDFQEVPTFLGYPDELNQVWTNLIYNAMQAMDFHGKLEIGIQQVGKEILVSFKDSGKGIPPEIKDKIFEAFFTTKPAGEGTGLGLSITKKIIDKHQGRIEIESEIGEGTTFKIYFPLEVM